MIEQNKQKCRTVSIDQICKVVTSTLKCFFYICLLYNWFICTNERYFMIDCNADSMLNDKCYSSVFYGQ